MEGPDVADGVLERGVVLLLLQGVEKDVLVHVSELPLGRISAGPLRKENHHSLWLQHQAEMASLARVSAVTS